MLKYVTLGVAGLALMACSSNVPGTNVPAPPMITPAAVVSYTPTPGAVVDYTQICAYYNAGRDWITWLDLWGDFAGPILGVDTDLADTIYELVGSNEALAAILETNELTCN